MHRVFQAFIDRLAESVDAVALRDAMTHAAAAFDLNCFAYLSMPHRAEIGPQIISTYPSDWTGHYLESRYERLDPVILQASRATEPFERSEEHTSELQSLMRISYAVFCLKKKKKNKHKHKTQKQQHQ